MEKHPNQRPNIFNVCKTIKQLMEDPTSMPAIMNALLYATLNPKAFKGILREGTLDPNVAPNILPSILSILQL
jgi:hypothetical protein